MKYKYKDIVFDDVTINGEGQVWSQICEQCVAKHGIDSAILDIGAGHGICGVESCKNNANHYIDFPICTLERI